MWLGIIFVTAAVLVALSFINAPEYEELEDGSLWPVDKKKEESKRNSERESETSVKESKKVVYQN